MVDQLLRYTRKPKLFAESSANMWNDEHISKKMLEAHLDPLWDAATRNHAFVIRSVEWIASILPPDQYPKLLDLGCGPGIYAEKFSRKGYRVIGVDGSGRSIDYARSSAHRNQLNIAYVHQDYLTLDYAAEFDVATLIYCDFGVLSEEARALLLQKIFVALKPGGALVLDVFTPRQYENKKEENHWGFQEGGFWSEKPYACLNAFYRYDESNTVLNQSIVITGEEIACYNIWEHLFTPEELLAEMSNAGFCDVAFYSDVAGQPYADDSKIICVVAKKKV